MGLLQTLHVYCTQLCCTVLCCDVPDCAALLHIVQVVCAASPLFCPALQNKGECKLWWVLPDDMRLVYSNPWVLRSAVGWIWQDKITGE